MAKPTHLLFVAGGGGGSTHLVNSIRRTGTPCVEKPNINTWYPQEWPPLIRTERGKPAIAGLHERPTATICRRFLTTQSKLSNSPLRFSLDPERTLAANLKEYFAFLRSHQVACVLDAVGIQGLVSLVRPRRVVFLIRDPIQSYLSFAKPERHLRYIKKLGGVDSEDAIGFWGWYWSCLADEYLGAQARRLNPILIRYESVSADLEKTKSPFLREVFSRLRPRSNDESRMSAAARGRLRELVSSRYEQIYGGDGTIG